jgi:hypothetical protein
VPGGVAKGDFAGLGALEVELQVVFPGEADAAMKLDAGAGDLAIGIRRLGLGH